jgi:hypothetical protein
VASAVALVKVPQVPIGRLPSSDSAAPKTALTTAPICVEIVIWFAFGSAHGPKASKAHVGPHVCFLNVPATVHPADVYSTVPILHAFGGSLHANDQLHEVVQVRVPQFPHGWVSPGVQMAASHVEASSGIAAPSAATLASAAVASSVLDAGMCVPSLLAGSVAGSAICSASPEALQPTTIAIPIPTPTPTQASLRIASPFSDRSRTRW